MNCSSCGHDNRADARFCGQCGAGFSIACAACGHSNLASNRFCEGCGDALKSEASKAGKAPGSYTPAHLAERILTTRSALEGERKQVTVLFCDLANSTELAHQVGPERMHDTLNAFFEQALAEVHRFEGTINQFLGDGFMALFGAPLAHEDHVRRALLAALAIQQKLHEAASSPSAGPLSKLRVRMGVNTGPVVVGRIGDNLRMDYTAIGDTTNIAARLQAVAQPGSICVGDSVQAVGEAFFEFRALGPKTLKGVSAPVATFELLRAHSAQASERHTRGLGIGAPLVGRDHELQSTNAVLGALRDGRGGLLMLTGEPGAGKSRLVVEMRRLPAGQAVRWLEGRALSFGRHLSYWPFIEILKRCFEIGDDDGEAVGFGKLRDGLLTMMGPRGIELLPYLATVLALPVGAEFEERVKHLDGPGLKRQVFLCMRQLFEHLARSHPLLLLLEDWHWADQSSIELAEHLLPLTQDSPLLICFATRPEPADAAARVRTAARALQPQGAEIHEIVLTPLSPSHSEVLLANLVGQMVLPATLREQILRRTEGNPFFVEEVVRSLVSQGALVRGSDGQGWQLGRPVDQVQLPDTLQGLIVSRIDRLEDEMKHALKLASVIGRSFFDRILEAISESHHRLPDQLRELEAVELIRDKQRAPEPEHIFKHALVQEAAYGSMLEENRRSIHRRVAQAIETLFADRLDEFSSLLAHHYTCAEDWEQAQAWLFKAGDQAGRMAADTEALEHLRRAESAYLKARGDRLSPLQRCALSRKVGAALFGTGHYEASHEHMRRGLTQLGLAYPGSRGGVRWATLRYLGAHLLRATRGRLGWPAARRMDLALATESSSIVHTMAWADYFLDKERMLLDSLIELHVGECSEHALAEARGLSSVGFGLMTLGLRGLSRRYHHRAQAVAQRSGNISAIAWAWMALAFLDFYEGPWDVCEDTMSRAVAGYREAGDIHRWGATALLVAWVRIARGDIAGAATLSSEIVRAGTDAGDRQMVSWGLQTLGSARIASGPLASAEATLRQGVDIARSVHSWDNMLHQLGHLVRCLLLQGRTAECAALVAEGHLIIQREKMTQAFDRVELLLAEAAWRLAEVEAASGPARAAALLSARKACRAAHRCAKEMPLWLPAALRLLGNLEWLGERRDAAQRHWAASLELAERSGFPIERGLTLLDMGTRLGDAARLDQAATLFRQTGASTWLAWAAPAETIPDEAGPAAALPALRQVA